MLVAHHLYYHAFSRLLNREREFTVGTGHPGVGQGGAMHHNTVEGNNKNASIDGYSLDQLMEPIALVKK